MSDAPAFALHPDLERDCVPVCDLDLCRVLLMDDANYPWLVLVPMRSDKRDFHDLTRADQQLLCDEITRCSLAMVELYGPDKMNVAALGNMTPQLHVHVIARWTTDPAWPGPIWGKVPRATYETTALETRIGELRGALEAA